MAEQTELPPFKTGGTSFPKSCFNLMNALSGIGLITLPYTLSRAGWVGLAFLLALAVVTCYTGLLLKRCMDANPAIKSYADIGWQAFGRKGKLVISTFMYLEVYLVPIGFLILEGDNLHKLFPKVSFHIGGHSVGGKSLFTMIAGLVILPSMWIKDLSWLSFVSATGVLSSVIIICSILWVGAVDGVGFSGKGDKVFELSGIPTALSLYAFCYGAHPVFPTICSSMKDKSQFSKVLLVSFGLSSLSYVFMAVIGYLMFGQNTLPQVTLNLPTNKISSKIAIYTILVGPIAKYALIISPIPYAIEDKLPARLNLWPILVLLRALLLLSTVIIALAFPYFGQLMALVGAILNVTVSIILPCTCYLKISDAYRRWGFEAVAIGFILVLAVLVGVLGTYSSVKDIVRHI